MIDESLILTYAGGVGFMSIASVDGTDATGVPGVGAWLHASDAIRVDGSFHESLSIRVRAVSSIVPTTTAVLIKIQVCPVTGYQDSVTLLTNVVTGGVIPIVSFETSSSVLEQLSEPSGDIYIPLRNLPMTANYIQLLIWTYPVVGSSPAEGIDAGRITAVLCPRDDNSSYPMPNGI